MINETRVYATLKFAEQIRHKLGILAQYELEHSSGESSKILYAVDIGKTAELLTEFTGQFQEWFFYYIQLTEEDHIKIQTDPRFELVKRYTPEKIEYYLSAIEERILRDGSIVLNGPQMQEVYETLGRTPVEQKIINELWETAKLPVEKETK